MGLAGLLSSRITLITGVHVRVDRYSSLGYPSGLVVVAVVCDHGSLLFDGACYAQSGTRHCLAREVGRKKGRKFSRWVRRVWEKNCGCSWHAYYRYYIMRLELSKLSLLYHYPCAIRPHLKLMFWPIPRKTLTDSLGHPGDLQSGTKFEARILVCLCWIIYWRVL